MNLRKPIALITENISNEIRMCERHEKKIEEFTGDIAELEKELYTPALDIVSTPLAQPITVCNDPECCEKKSCGNTTKVHYKSICHKPCYLQNTDGNIIGNSALLDCQAFNKYDNYRKGCWSSNKSFHPDSNVSSSNKKRTFGYPCDRTRSEICFQCSHSYQVHLTINYETEIETKQIRDDNKYERIESSHMDIDKLRFITECSAYFARFLMNNCVTPFNDALDDYIKCCIDNEEKGNADAVVIKGFHDMLEAYNREKATIEKLSKETCGESDLTSGQIDGKIGQLFKLKHYGHVIEYHMNLESIGRQNTKVALERDIFIGQKNTSALTAVVNRIFSTFKFW